METTKSFDVANVVMPESIQNISNIQNIRNQIKSINVGNIEKYTLIVTSIVLYVFALYKMTKYSPSATACFNQPNQIMNNGLIFMGSISSLIFLGLYLTLLGSGDKPISVLITLIVCAITIGFGVHFFFKCASINKNINFELNENNSIKSLQVLYNELMIGVQPISKCITYHTGDYYTTKNTECREIEGCVTSAAAACDQRNGAKLVDFYVASSHQSCVAPYSSGNYVSTEMLKTVLQAGARFLDFDIYPEILNNEIIPVVRSEYRGLTSLNYLLMEDVFEIISSYGFVDKYGDPLLIHLNIKTNNVGVMDKIANTFVDSIHGDHILPPRYSYHSKKSIAREPVCTLLNKIILIVTGECSHTLLDELVNLHTSNNARILTSKEVSSPVNPKSFAFSNQNIYTIVIPEEYEDNTNPEVAWTYGCHAFMMNYWKLTEVMKSHCEFFKQSSFVMKKLNLQEDRVNIRDIIEQEKEKENELKEQADIELEETETDVMPNVSVSKDASAAATAASVPNTKKSIKNATKNATKNARKSIKNAISASDSPKLES